MAFSWWYGNRPIGIQQIVRDSADRGNIFSSNFPEQDRNMTSSLLGIGGIVVGLLVRKHINNRVWSSFLNAPEFCVGLRVRWHADWQFGPVPENCESPNLSQHVLNALNFEMVLECSFDDRRSGIFPDYPCPSISRPGIPNISNSERDRRAMRGRSNLLS
jgi:hypothetical protein